jgi:hypothetical protein
MENKKQTAAEWLIKQVNSTSWSGLFIWHKEEIFEQALKMEKDQIMKAARQCHFEGLRQTGKNSEEYLKYGNDYYNQTYNK